MTRTSVVTGSASGIGKATKELLESRGERVIGVDLHGADVTADLTTEQGRAAMVDGVRELSGGAVDAVYAVAGLSQPAPATVAVNYFGAVATLEGLRPLLLTSAAPRAVVVSSMAALHPVDEPLVAALRAGDEIAALSRAEVMAKEPESLGRLIYSSSKRAISQWVRRQAPTALWAGAAIPLNAIGPGIIATAMTADLISTEEKKAALLEMVPMPLNGVAEAEAVAHLLAWLGGVHNTHLCGQVIYIDGGSDAVIRGDSIW
ncbi:SDR family oxidoreductase [Phytohabitans sp. ZYX-F-186]|uniref:SDR family oxidoreductase n=1 Tax=Phytohabitans maris TaxID=3071409 RepID=A0ABU0ZMI4_9ACTN|nr:SDR family NAD(P)-dependent oxidoreductase [Phytohabitans sp. ZYX-F-186]MDQ7908248.1 SDR family oxidoreductase [Phytohabitans sp. ZYX-F-186]